MITFSVHGSFAHSQKFFNKSKEFNRRIRDILTEYGRIGVEALKRVTPKDTGKTAASWRFKVTNRLLTFTNDNVDKNGTPIAILIQYGHGSKNGLRVIGQDYINPVMQPIFDKIIESIWKEVTLP